MVSASPSQSERQRHRQRVAVSQTRSLSCGTAPVKVTLIVDGSLVDVLTGEGDARARARPVRSPSYSYPRWSRPSPCNGSV
jgi:hypothetical protein